jgi:hypothetical protein
MPQKELIELDEPLQVVRYARTSFEPSKWEGITEDGKKVTMSYEKGALRGEVNGKPFLDEPNAGLSTDNYMDEGQMQRRFRTKLNFHPPA